MFRGLVSASSSEVLIRASCAEDFVALSAADVEPCLAASSSGHRPLRRACSSHPPLRRTPACHESTQAVLDLPEAGRRRRRGRRRRCIRDPEGSSSCGVGNMEPHTLPSCRPSSKIRRGVFGRCHTCPYTDLYMVSDTQGTNL